MHLNLTARFFQSSASSSSITKPPELSTNTIGSLGNTVARILKIILPRSVFCWMSRISIQIQSILAPKRWSYWTQLSDKIIVGAIPLKNWNHHEQLSQLGVGAVLSINKKHEFNDLPFSQPVQKKEWQERKIEFLRVSSEDLAPVELTKLSKAVDFVVEQVNLGKIVYVQCTGGRGRSVSAAIAGLVRTKQWTVEHAYNHVIQLRRQAILSQQQLESVIKMFKE
jgi:protein-tyrosine phosphatase